MSDDKKVKWHPPMRIENNPINNFQNSIKEPINENFSSSIWETHNPKAKLPNDGPALSGRTHSLYSGWKKILTAEAEYEKIIKPKRFKSDPHISKKFFDEIEKTAKKLGCTPEDLAAIIYKESHFDPSARDTTGTYHGLIQMDATALENTIKFAQEKLGAKSRIRKISYNQYKKLPREEQIKYTETYLQYRINEKGLSGKKLTAGQLYTLIRRPTDINKPSIVRTNQKIINDVKTKYKNNLKLLDTKG